MPPITRTTANAGQVSGGLAINDVAFRSARAKVATHIESWLDGVKAGAAAGDSDGADFWVDVTDATLTLVEIVASGTFSGSVQASINGGTTFFDILPDTGSTGTTNPITANGIYRFTGAYEYIRFHTTAIQASNTVKTAISFVLL